MTPDTEFFWTSGADGVLRIAACEACDLLIHPPAPFCPRCHGREVSPRPVSGDAVVYSYTLLTHDHPEPVVIAIVELVEQPGLRFMTNVVGCAPEDVRIDMPVRVTFERQEDLMIPVFEPADRP